MDTSIFPRGSDSVLINVLMNGDKSASTLIKVDRQLRSF